MSVLARRPFRIILGVVVALVLFGGGFALGSNAKVATSGATGATGSTGAAVTRVGAGPAGAGGAAARGLVNGQILAINRDSITITMRQAGQGGASATTTTALVLVGGGTRVVKTVETDVKLTDLKVGDTVTVAGTPDATSGTISAQAIVLGGNNILGDILGGQFPGGRGAGASGSPRPSPTR
jgi:hypothetical protein